MIQQIHSIFSANGQQVVPATVMEKKNKNQLVSCAPATLFNIFSQWATGCPDDCCTKKETIMAKKKSTHT